ncbi:hypothetical protein LSH36_660g02038 [Paralvinella palmiformis]|uniref:Uncharacterized protein n=1 Tax=Paralvinella palmiformis TaxID=53620 RepID=A0AAD9J429_9ANNE|nr:hypothetical protein LSH36_660g02038 [Paralvinella palmiformis]
MKRFSSHQNMYASFLNFKHDQIHSLHIKPSSCSFNVGVYVFNADLWREQNITRQLEHWLELNTREEIYGSGRAEGGSQPPMLIVFYDKYTPISPLWNLRYLGLYPKARYSEHFVLRGKLLHWNGPYKPWNGVAQFTKLWDKYFIPDPSGKFVPVRKMQLKGAKQKS